MNSLADDFYEHAFAPPSVELAVEDLLPRAEVELAVGDGDDDFTSHDLAFQVGVGVVFTGAIVMVLRSRLVRRQLFQPDSHVKVATRKEETNGNGKKSFRYFAKL